MTSAGIDWQREKWQSGLGSKFIHQGEKNAAKYADEVIVLSKGVQDYFKETYGRKTHFIPNGVNRPQIREASLITDKFGLKKDSWSVRKMNLSEIHHIAIIVSDYEAAKDFYVNKLGFSVIRENYRPERKDWKLDLRVNEHTELEIFAEENPPKRVNRPEACGLRHLAFCVDSVEQTVNELAEVGIECEPIRVDDYTGKKMTFFHDPDGLPLELHE